MATLREKLNTQVQEALKNEVRGQVDEVQATEEANTAIDAGAVSNAQGTQMPQNRDLAQLNQGITNILEGVTPEERQQRNIAQQRLDLGEQLALREPTRQRVGEELGVGEAQERVAQAQQRVGSISTQMQQAPLVVQEEAEGRGQTRFTTNVRESDAQRLLAIQGLQAVGEFDVAQSNLNLLKQERDERIEAQFAPLEAEQASLESFYEMNQDILQRQDRKKANKLNVFLNERSRILQNEKETQKTIQNFSLNAAANGADAQTVQSIQNAESIEDAIAVGGNNIVDPQTRLAQQQLRETIINNEFGRSMQVQQLETARARLQAEQAQVQIAEGAAQLRKQRELATQNIDLQGDINDINRIMESPYFSAAFGPNIFSRGVIGSQAEVIGGIVPFLPGDVGEGLRGLEGAVSGETSQIRDILNRLISQETLDAMEQLKGTPSDEDARIAADAATNIRESSTEKTMRRELPRLAKSFRNIQKNNAFNALSDEELVESYSYAQQYANQLNQ